MISNFTKRQIKFFVITLNGFLTALFFYPIHNPELAYLIVGTYCLILFLLIHNDFKTIKATKDGIELNKE